MAAPKNPPWSREELLLALELYVRHRPKLLTATHPDVAELSRLLNRLGRLTGLRTEDRFRNENGVAMKLSNFAAIDPSYDGKGLEGGGRAERELWEHYLGEPEQIIREARRLAAEARRDDSLNARSALPAEPLPQGTGMQLGLTGRRVLITGGSKGIGLACARAFADAGCDVTLAARDAGALEAAVASLRLGHRGRFAAIAADLSRDEERARCVAEAGEVDILVNNAGAIPGGRLHDIPMPRWREAWDLKVLGTIHMTQLLLPAMEARGSGIICNIIGMAGRAPHT
jgi:hypothetical protein